MADEVEQTWKAVRVYDTDNLVTQSTTHLTQGELCSILSEDPKHIIQYFTKWLYCLAECCLIGIIQGQIPLNPNTVQLRGKPNKILHKTDCHCEGAWATEESHQFPDETLRCAQSDRQKNCVLNTLSLDSITPFVGLTEPYCPESPFEKGGSRWCSDFLKGSICLIHWVS